MSVITVPMPRLSDSMEQGTIVRWLVAEGEQVQRGQEIVEIETDKATMAFEAPAEGPLWIFVAENATVGVGETIAQIGGKREAAAVPSAPAPDNEAVVRSVPATGAAAADRGVAEVRVSPVARRLAAARGVDLHSVSGSGPGGRIVKEDVLAAAEATHLASKPLIGTRGVNRRLEPTRTQTIVARRMSESRATVPEFPVSVHVRMNAAIELRRQLKVVLDPAPTLNDLLTAAIARTLRAHPRLNAAYIDGGFEFYDDVNVGIAVAVEDELMVPVLSGADRLSLGEVAERCRRLIERTRRGVVTPPELAGGTFTISNLGMFGISWFQPIVNPPQAAILGVGGIQGADEGRPTVSLTVVCDHRIVYGAHAARFLADLRGLIEAPVALVASA